ncbi:AAA family ATPase [Treponema pectinovorum]|uniref:AAA family ATPase n=1 Tax=Treponema pectinovorum TaxID=164 RepID=UPI0011F2852D|nr:AAA family ATPase [Treponema pectinovorum]
MSDLFDASKLQKEPLAARLRPRNLDEFIGQDHIVGKGRLLRRAIAADQLTSVIFYGPPGCGKTTLAKVIANHTKSNFITLNAVLTGVAEIRTAIKQADDYFKLYSRHTILFVDEVHRWNKAQQDALLPWVENGTIILIGATTENPFFEVNKALVSRSRVFQLKPLTKEDLIKAAHFALSDLERGYGHWNVQFEEGALEHLVDTANGDARSLLNAIELAVETTPEKWDPYNANPLPPWGSTIKISKEVAEESIQKKVVLYDRDGDYHYDIISAFIKSLRGRDPDAAMYWLARMVKAGEDPHFIFRRMLISACEDTGLADPYAISVVTSCADAFDRVGLPEGRYHLAHAALYLATCPKSNSSMAFFDALSSVEKDDAQVPNHLKDSNRDAEGFGHGEGYLYPHAYRDHWVAQQYLPVSLVGRVFYTPSQQGYEAKIREEVFSRREIQISMILQGLPPENSDTDSSWGMHPRPHFPEDFENPIGEWWINKAFDKNTTVKEENLTFTPTNQRKESALDRAEKAWRSRLDSNKAEILTTIRDAMIQLADLSRHTRSLIWNADDSLLLWEVSRKTPEGATAGLCFSQRGLEILEQYGRTLDNLDKPFLMLRPQSLQNYLNAEVFQKVLENYSENGIIFDRIFFRDPFASQDSADVLAYSFSKLSSTLVPKNMQVIISQKIPCKGQKISALIYNQILTESTRQSFSSILKKMEDAENDFFNDNENPLFNWNEKSIRKSFEDKGFSVRAASKVICEKRQITENEINRWFDSKSSSYGSAMNIALGEEDLNKIKNLLLSACQNTIFSWNSIIEFMSVSVIK